jgi:hypothetical protein
VGSFLISCGTISVLRRLCSRELVSQSVSLMTTQAVTVAAVVTKMKMKTVAVTTAGHFLIHMAQTWH